MHYTPMTDEPTAEGNVTQFFTESECVVTISTISLNNNERARESEHVDAIAAVRETLDAQDEY